MCIRYFNGVFQVALVVKKLPASAGDEGLIPGSGRSSKEYEMIICPVVFFFYITIHKRDDQCKLDAWSRTLRAGVLKQSKGWRREEGECGVLDGGTHAHPWLIHVDVWQYTHFNAILSNHPTLAFSLILQKSVLYICVSFVALCIGSLLPSF